jgi:hypothetical protein
LSRFGFQSAAHQSRATAGTGSWSSTSPSTLLCGTKRRLRACSNSRWRRATAAAAQPDACSSIASCQTHAVASHLARRMQ